MAFMYPRAAAPFVHCFQDSKVDVFVIFRGPSSESLEADMFLQGLVQRIIVHSPDYGPGGHHATNHTFNSPATHKPVS